MEKIIVAVRDCMQESGASIILAQLVLIPLF